MADPFDPGAMPGASVVMNSKQVVTLIETVSDHKGSVRVEQLRDGYVRVVLFDSEGHPSSERLLFCT